MIRRILVASAACLLCSVATAADAQMRSHTFENPIDAISIGLPTDSIDLSLRGFDGNSWTPWEALNIENEQDPLLRESNLIIFPQAVEKIELRGTTLNYDLHPIHVSDAPARRKVAATGSSGNFSILSRADWGADDSFLFVNEDKNSSQRPPAKNEDAGDNGDTTVSKRVQDCEDAQRQYPDEFKADNKTLRDSQGRLYRWPLTYSPKVRLLVVHHTAIAVGPDLRPAIERVRALYQYHANSRGWGDVGYHYLVDESGKIYEGKAGGPMVIGGHAYCNNTGTIGVALLGNFDIEKPTQVQMQALQWLLDDLADRYDIATDRDVRYHGKIMSPIVAHRDLLSTDCPGFYAYGVMAQVREHVKNRDLVASVSFPVKPGAAPYVSRADERKASRIANPPNPVVIREGLVPIGSQSISGPPGGQQAFSMNYFAAGKAKRNGQSIGTVGRSDPGITLWQEKNGTYTRVRTTLNLPSAIKGSDTAQLRFKIQMPRQAGDYVLKLDKWTYALHVAGKRLRSAEATQPKVMVAKSVSSVPLSAPARRNSLSRDSVLDKKERATSNENVSSNDKPIRIRLSYTDPTAQLSIPNTSDIRLTMNGTACESDRGTNTNGIVRIDPGTNIITIKSWNKPTNKFRGVIECRVIDGALVLINELPLEDYMTSLAEEPDTEPYEKQRAFAIAARTYAAYYMDPAHRKFPGMPYDGSDSPANFQAYGGVAFENNNPRWMQAVRNTANLVIVKDNQIIRAPYFSSDSGRTKTPEEAGWKNFPFAEIFTSKADPWCEGETDRGHGVGMSGCGSEGQANEGKTAEQILDYYYPGTELKTLSH